MKSYPEGITPKLIASLSGVNVNTVKNILPRLDNVQKVLRGVYKVVEWGDTPQSNTNPDLTKWNFHNCVLSTTINDYKGKLITRTHSLKLLNLEFVLNTKGKATLRASTDYPLNVSSLCMVGGFLIEELRQYSNSRLKFDDVSVSTIEFNRDFANLRLDGVKCITLDSLSEQFKIYQKKIGLRIEHKTKVKFSVQNVVDMLSTDPNSLEININLAKQKEQLDRLTIAMSIQKNLLFKAIDVMNKNLGDE